MAGARNAKISVWWDIENCPVPKKVDSHDITGNIDALLRHHAKLTGPIARIDVFGDARVISQKTALALSSTGINVNHVPCGKDAADKAMLLAMLFWAFDNPPPAHVFVISGDGYFSDALYRLRFRGYNVLLAHPDQTTKSALLGAATRTWYWKSVAHGTISAPDLPKSRVEQFSDSYYADSLMGVKTSDPSSPCWSSCLGNCNSGSSNERSTRPDTVVNFPDLNNNIFKYPFPSAQSSCLDSMSCERVKGEETNNSDALPTTVNNVADKNLRTGRTCHGFFINSLQNKLDKIWTYICHLLPYSAKNMVFTESLGREEVLQLLKRIESIRDKDVLTDYFKLLFQFPKPQYLPTPVGESSFLSLSASMSFIKIPEATNKIFGFLRYCFQNFILRESTQNIIKQEGTMITLFSNNLSPADLLENKKPRCSKLYFKSEESVCDKVVENAKKMKIENQCSQDRSCLATLSDRKAVSEFNEMSACIQNEGVVSVSASVSCISDGNGIDISKKSVMKEKLRDWLIETLREKHQFDICNIPKAFKDATGLHLNIKMLHKLIEDLLNERSFTILKKGSKFLCYTAKEKAVSTSNDKFSARRPVCYPANDDTPMTIVFKEMLKCWLVQTLRDKQYYDICSLRKDFHDATGFTLDVEKLGYPKLVHLLREFAYEGSVKVYQRESKVLCSLPKKKKRTHMLEQHSSTESNNWDSWKKHFTMEILRLWLIDTLQSRFNYDISSIPRDFELATGKHLEPKKLGYSKLSYLLEEFSNDIFVDEVRAGMRIIRALSKGSVSTKAMSTAPAISKCSDSTKAMSTAHCISDLSSKGNDSTKAMGTAHEKSNSPTSRMLASEVVKESINCESLLQECPKDIMIDLSQFLSLSFNQELLIHSYNKAQAAHFFKKYGPVSIKSLPMDPINKLVDYCVDKLKWITVPGDNLSSISINSESIHAYAKMHHKLIEKNVNGNIQGTSSTKVSNFSDVEKNVNGNIQGTPSTKVSNFSDDDQLIQAKGIHQDLSHDGWLEVKKDEFKTLCSLSEGSTSELCQKNSMASGNSVDIELSPMPNISSSLPTPEPGDVPGKGFRMPCINREGPNGFDYHSSEKLAAPSPGPKGLNINSLQQDYPRDILVDLSQYLCLTEIQELIIKSNTKGQLIQILKHYGPPTVQNLHIDQLNGLLHHCVHNMKWINVSGEDWSAINLNLLLISEFANLYGTESTDEHLKLASVKFFGKNSYEVSSQSLIVKEKLKSWLVGKLKENPNYDIVRLRKDFLDATGIHIDLQKLGHSKLRGLVEELAKDGNFVVKTNGLKVLCSLPQTKKSEPQFTAINDNSITLPAGSNMLSQPLSASAKPNISEGIENKGSYYSSYYKMTDREKVKSLILKKLRESLDYDIGSLPKDFQDTTGKHLDVKKLGFTKLSLLVEELSLDGCMKVKRHGSKVVCSLPKAQHQCRFS